MKSDLLHFLAISCVALLVQGANIDVTVGGPGVLKYSPEFVNANPGDVVRFYFKQKNHTATQSTFENPCVRAQNGFDSGFVPVPDTQTSDFPVAELTIIDASPVWVYCRQANHCQQGMVFAINPGDEFVAFQAAATGGTPQASTTSSTPSGSVVTVTATVTVSGQPITTTYASYPGSSAPTTAVATDHKVVVGGPGKLTYEPSNITAQPGDTITFEFHQKNHTATASSFAAPCRALSLTSTTGEIGFDSGFMPVADNATTFPTFTVKVNDTKPIWVYCRQGNHCGQGMVFSANAVESGPNNFAAFKAKAMQLNATTSAPAQNAAAKIPSHLDASILGASMGILLQLCH
ncbi:hypothetical protein LshimejAT787_0206280 [Lyophyllum shimeji]|uniref:Cupredoxin n=1 Tax=Lyophyllum shimeji TaxID=47721 RepID=A0A9P3UIY5_LYOSH|nr:hypothetical protein LshimejAT787_0206280 [Lyophyllum shimeji]